MSFESLLNKSFKKKYLPYQITLRKKKQEQKITKQWKFKSTKQWRS